MPAPFSKFHMLGEDYGRETRRVCGRVKQELLKTDYGPVFDLSGSGVRLLTKKDLEGELDLTFKAPEKDITVKARVVWSRKLGFRRYEIGLQFLELDEETSRDLTSICSLYRLTMPEVA